MYRVQLWPDGKWDGQPYKKVEAPSKKEAAEQLHGGLLSETGGHYQIRARVRASGQGEPQEFYER